MLHFLSTSFVQSQLKPGFPVTQRKRLLKKNPGKTNRDLGRGE